MKHTTPIMNSKVHSGLGVIMVFLCRFNNSNKCTHMVGEVDNGEDYGCVWPENRWDIFVPFSQFCCESKTALKKVS